MELKGGKNSQATNTQIGTISTVGASVKDNYTDTLEFTFSPSADNPFTS